MITSKTYLKLVLLTIFFNQNDISIPFMAIIGYSIMAHKNPDQVSRLLNHIYNDEDFFHIQIFKTKETPPIDIWEKKLLPNKCENILISSDYKASYATFNLVQATIDAMQHFSKYKYDYFINLSGQCYPLKHINQIKKELDQKNIAYMHYDTLPSDKLHKTGLNRIHYHWFLINKYSLLIPKIRKKLPYNLQPYWGWNWFCLPRYFIDYILQYIDEHPKLKSYFKYSICVDELFFQTIVLNSELKSKIVKDNKRYIDWNKKGVKLPAILLTEDYEKIIQSNMWFGRKFDTEIDSNILDMIDTYIDNHKDTK